VLCCCVAQGAALAALGMCDVPSAAAYVAAVLEALPLDGRGTLRAILQQVSSMPSPPLRYLALDCFSRPQWAESFQDRFGTATVSVWFLMACVCFA
jgi:hypothetical protein